MTEEISPLWAAIERPAGTWEVIDNRTSTVYVVESRLGHHLWRQDDLWALPLRQALEAATATARDEVLSPPLPDRVAAFLDLELAGLRVRYRASDPTVLAELKTNLAVAQPQRRSTADVLVRLDAQAHIELLHRSVGGDRPGVQYRLPHDPQWRALAGTLPALPPLAAPPYSGRFCALHAALLVLPSGRGLIVCGNQKAGKTTATQWARESGLAAVATDEVVLLDASTAVTFGIPLASAVRSGGQRTTVPLTAGPATHLGAALPAAVVVLTPAAHLTAGTMTTANTDDEAMAWLAEHLRDAGASPSTMQLCTRTLVARVPVHRLAVSPWPGLPADLDVALTPMLKTLEHCR